MCGWGVPLGTWPSLTAGVGHGPPRGTQLCQSIDILLPTFGRRISGPRYLVPLICYRSSALQASMLLSLWMVTMRPRETTTLSRPPHAVLSSSLHPGTLKGKSNLYPDKKKIKLTISWRPFLTFFNEMKLFCMLLQPFKVLK